MDTHPSDNVDQERKPARNFPPAGAKQEPPRDSSLEELFRRLRVETGNSGEEKVSDVLEAVQRVVLQMDAAESAGSVAEAQVRRTCHACGGQNPPENRFCARCGVPLMDAAERHEVPSSSASPAATGPGQHHYHHHYHHHYFASSEGMASLPTSDSRAANAPIAREGARARTPAASGFGRAETAVRKLAQDWAQACNTKHLDDLVDLYAPDATVVRPNVPPVRSTAAIREFFFTALEAGLGDVEMETLRIELFGDTAYDVGRCTMLVPSATGKRREERGKYVILATRQAGEWKIVLDCWSTDLNLAAGAESSPAKGQGPGSPISRTPAKSA